MTRKVTVYSTIGGNLTYIDNFGGSVYADLTKEFDARGIAYNNMSVVEGSSQVTYESPVAVLPSGDFQIFLAPKKVKSGYHKDSEYLNDLEGISWNDEEWSSDLTIPEDYQFKSKKDLAIARAKKAQSYLEKVIQYLIEDEKKAISSPEVSALQKTAEEIKRNLGLYD